MSTSPSESRGRVKLDLEEFFTDYRRQSYILIKNAWSTVKDLKDYIEETFELKDVVIMTSDEVFLPPNEALDIVADDELKVVTTFHVPTTTPKETEETSSGQADDTIKLKPKRKRTHKRKLPNADKSVQAVAAKIPPKVPKTDSATNVTHVYFDDDCEVVKAGPSEVKFVNYIDTLDAKKPRVITANVKKACGPKIVSCGIDSKEDKAKVEIPTAVEIAAV